MTHLNRATRPLLALIVAIPAIAKAEAPLTLAVAGPPVTVFNHAHDACDVWDIPDAPSRAIRTASGEVLLFATHFHNHLLRGPDLQHVRANCHEVFSGAESDDPSTFNDRGWLAAPFTRDGVNIIAIVHNEFQGHRRPALCPTGRYMDCWYNALTMAVSHDAGQSFLPAGLVAALPYRYDEVTGSHRGYFNPSNIVPFGQYQVMLVFATAARAQLPGNCLLRTDQPEDATKWRGWDGAAFNVQFINPYKQQTVPGQHVCTPIGAGQLRWPVTSLVRQTKTGIFIATMLNAAPDGGVFYATSADLLTWSPPVRLMAAEGEGAWHCADAPPVAYPSILDPTSDDPSFATIGNAPMLFLTRYNAHNCALGPDRDLVRFPLELTDNK